MAKNESAKGDKKQDDKVDTSTKQGSDKAATLDKQGRIQTDHGPLPPPTGR